MSTRSIFPTGGARTPRLAMTAADAISLYRFEKANAAARHYDSLDAERDTLAAAMARSWGTTSKSRQNVKPHVPTSCMCGCGLMCLKGRRTATTDCWKQVRAEARRHCLHCRATLTGDMARQNYCGTQACQREKRRRKSAARRERQAMARRTTPNNRSAA